MSISQRQIQTVTDKAVETLLKAGQLPNTADINKYVDTFFAGKTPGLPYYRPTEVAEGEVSDPDSYNRMFQDLKTDLDTIFSENIYQNNRIVSMFDYYATEKERLDAAVEKLQLRVDGLLDSLKSSKATEGFIESFNNFYGVELYGDKARNIPKTSAFVDLVQRKVYNEKLTRPQDKIDISSASITITPVTTINGSTVLGAAENILKDSTNETCTWIFTKNGDGECIIELLVKMKDAATASSVVINTKSTKAANISLQISEDNVNYKDLMDIDTASFAEWNFNRMPVKFMKFIIKKYEPDGDTGSSSEYYFTICNISLVNDNFMNKNVFVSKPITINKIPDKATLITEDVIYPNTDIKYYLGIDNGIDKVDWRLVQSGVPYDFGLLTPRREIVTNNVSPYNYDGKVSRICKLHENTDKNTINLMLGYQMWFHERFSLPDSVVNETDASGRNIFEPGIGQMIYPKIGNSFYDCEIYDLNVKAGELNVYTQYVICGQDVSISHRKIIGSVKHSIYVNNIVVQPIDGKYTINLVKGINKVQMCIYSYSDTTVSHNINMKNASFDIYCRLALRQVTEHNLISNIKDEDLNFFAVDSEGYIIVKYDPKKAGLCYNINNDDLIRYVVEYKYIPNDVLTAYPDNTLKIRVMATLTSSYDDISPQIMNYRIISE